MLRQTSLLRNAKFQAYVADVAAQALASSAADMDSFMAEKMGERTLL